VPTTVTLTKQQGPQPRALLPIARQATWNRHCPTTGNISQGRQHPPWLWAATASFTATNGPPIQHQHRRQRLPNGTVTLDHLHHAPPAMAALGQQQGPEPRQRHRQQAAKLERQCRRQTISQAANTALGHQRRRQLHRQPTASKRRQSNISQPPANVPSMAPSLWPQPPGAQRTSIARLQRSAGPGAPPTPLRQRAKPSPVRHHRGPANISQGPPMPPWAVGRVTASV